MRQFSVFLTAITIFLCITVGCTISCTGTTQKQLPEVAIGDMLRSDEKKVNVRNLEPVANPWASKFGDPKVTFDQPCKTSSFAGEQLVIGTVEGKVLLRYKLSDADVHILSHLFTGHTYPSPCPPEVLFFESVEWVAHQKLLELEREQFKEKESAEREAKIKQEQELAQREKAWVEKILKEQPRP